MPITKDRLIELQAEAFAEDVEVLDAMLNWSEADAVAYFDSGGTVKPVDTMQKKATPLDPPLLAVLQLLDASKGQGIDTLSELLMEQNLADLAKHDRAGLLGLLKTLGMTSLVQRQNLATLVAKAAKSVPTAATVAPPTAAPPSKVVDVSDPVGGGATRAELPRPGAAAAAQRKKVAPLPPYRRLTGDDLKRTATLNLAGEWYGVLLPTGLKQLGEWGAPWLTKAFHAAGSLDADDSVTAITSFEEMELQGFDAQGGAGEKALLTVEYAKPDNGLHTRLFVKCPWTYEGEHGKYNRTLLSVQYGDGDGLELSTYQFLEGLLPMRIPKLYYADICRESSNYFLITECVPFTARGRTTKDTLLDWRDTPPKLLLPKSGKYQDDRLADAHLYYMALFKAMARMAAADKLGVFDEHMGVFGASSSSSLARPVPDTPGRRALLTKRASDHADMLITFITTCAYNVFPPPLNDASYLQRFKKELVETAPYLSAMQNASNRPELNALSHVNLQIDNAFFWRESEDATELECGLLDWYNLSRVAAVSVWGGCLSGCDADTLVEHEASIMGAFASEYKRYGGPEVDPAELVEMYHRTVPMMIIQMIVYIQTEVYPQGPSKAEWPSIHSVWDPRIMGVWQVRCRVVGLIQLCRYWEKAGIHKATMDWVQKRRPGIDRV